MAGEDDDTGKTRPKSESSATMPAAAGSGISLQHANNVKVPSELSWTGNMAENWAFFKQKFNIYLIASRSKTESDEYQIALLLSTIGDRALKIYNNFTYTATKDSNSFTIVLSKFEEYFVPDKKCNL